MQKHLLSLICCLFAISPLLIAQPTTDHNKFRQLNEELPTPNVYRTGSGAPGHEYWQQRADYDMKITIDDEKQRLDGDETITYYNNSPDQLEYLWVQLDQNVRAKDSDSYKIANSSISERMSAAQLKRMMPWFDGGFKIMSVTDAKNKALSYTINKTMMRINLPTALKPGENVTFNIKWWYNINDRMKIGGRGGYEYFEKDGNYLYTIAQYFPRMAVYSDNDGWKNKQFLGRGEFALTFGDYKVALTVPADHIVSSTGELQNPEEVLTKTQRERYKKAQSSFEEPVIIVTQDEAEKAEKTKSKKTKTWIYHADNVRDFAFATSRKFIWDAMAVKQADGTTVMAMSYYPKEGNPLWEQYSTKVVAHTLKWYSHYTFPYPYPVAISVHAGRIGMEYPMICFNFGRPNEDGTYSERVKYGMIGVIIHEVGHNYFPMIVNSDERQWTWMDEGLNTFLQYLTEQEFERDYPSRRGPAHKITRYMKGDKKRISPIMTNSESIYQFGANAYSKPATALNILRETVMGRELFDHAFKTYSNRWKFKHPEPADFFRTMEDASAVDLDWFWHGWFFTNDHVDISINEVRWMQFDSKNPDVNKQLAAERNKNVDQQNISFKRNREQIKQTYNEKDKGLNDFYTTYDPYKVDRLDREAYKKYRDGLGDEERSMLDAGYNFYEIEFENVGGLVMPLILQFEFTDGSEEVLHIPAEIWKMTNTTERKMKKVFPFKKEVKQITLDPYIETADTEVSNNYWPPKPQPSRFELYKRGSRSSENKMQRAERAKKK